MPLPLAVTRTWAISATGMFLEIVEGFGSAFEWSEVGRVLDESG